MGAVTFYYNSADKRVLDKDDFLTTKKTFSDVKFKDDSSIMTPTLIVNYDSKIFESNYVKIDAFSRYYFITNITVSQQYLLVECKVDVLQTFKDEIKTMSGYYNRTSTLNKANKYVVDNRFPIQRNKFASVIDPTSSVCPFGDYGDSGWVLACGYGWGGE